jgi:hypothetical protein
MGMAKAFVCSGYRPQTRKPDLGTASSARSSSRHGVREASSTVGTHEANLCRVWSLAKLV